MGNTKPSLDEIFSQPASSPNRPSLDDIFKTSAQPQAASDLPEGLEPSDSVDSSIRGALNAFTGGHMPQIAGALTHPIGAAKTLIQGGMGNDVSADPDVAAYSKTRDQYKHLYNQAWDNHPIAYGAGYVPGLIASPVNKLGAPAAAGLIAESNSDADLTKGEIGKELYDTSKGVLLGKGLSSVGKFISNRFAPAASDALGTQAENLTTLHLQPEQKLAQQLGSDGLRSVARDVLDSGAIKLGNKAASTASNLGEILDNAATQEALPVTTPGPFNNFPPAPGTPLLNSMPEAVQTGNLELAKQMADRVAAKQAAGGGFVGQLETASMVPTIIGGLMHGNIAPALGWGARLATKGRIASSGAYVLDALSQRLQTAPQSLGQFAAPLAAAANRGKDSLAVTNFLLGQQYPAYRQILSTDEDAK